MSLAIQLVLDVVILSFVAWLAIQIHQPWGWGAFVLAAVVAVIGTGEFG